MWGLKTWVGAFFPAKTKQKDFLASYSRRLNTVEGNTTFYALPDLATVERWRDETPAGFKFCLKVPQEISHRRRLNQIDAELGAFAERLGVLQDRCGPSFLQLPPTFSGKQLPTLLQFLEKWPQRFPLAVEPRHADYAVGGTAEAPFKDALRQHNMAVCEFDTRGLRSPSAASDPITQEALERKPNFAPTFVRTASFAFVRYCGHPQVDQNDVWLDEWAGHAATWLKRGDDVFFFTHHPDDTYAPEVARRLHALIAKRTTIEALPDWVSDGQVQAPTQGSLFG